MIASPARQVPVRAVIRAICGSSAIAVLFASAGMTNPVTSPKIATALKGASQKQSDSQIYSTAPFVQRKWLEHKQELPLRAGSSTQLTDWQIQLRKRIWRLLGITFADHEDIPLSASIIQRKNQSAITADGRKFSYRLEKVRFQTARGLWSYGYFLVPQQLVGKRANACIVCLHGHTMNGELGGVEQIIGLSDGLPARKLWTGYQKDFALQCVAEGFPVFAVEQMGMGDRLPPLHGKSPSSVNGCALLARNASLIGETLMGWRVFDAVRAIDYVQTRSEIDPRKIGLMGVSIGGTIAMYTAALDPRVRCTAISNGATTLSKSLAEDAQCVCNYVPQLATVCDVGEILALVAPRAVIVEHDRAAAANEALSSEVETARKAFSLTRSTSRLQLDLFEGGHRLNGKNLYRFMKDNLSDRTK